MYIGTEKPGKLPLPTMNNNACYGGIRMESFKHGEITEFIQWYDTDGNII